MTYKRMYRGLGGPIKQYARTLVQETSEPLTALWVSGWSDCFFSVSGLAFPKSDCVEILTLRGIFCWGHG